MSVTATTETAAEFDLVIEGGITLEQKTWWKSNGTDLTVGLENWTARSQIRSTRSSDAVLHEMTTENGGISMGDTLGEITFNISAIDTDTFTWSSGVWDVEIVDTANKVYRYMKGNVRVIRGITR